MVKFGYFNTIASEIGDNEKEKYRKFVDTFDIVIVGDGGLEPVCKLMEYCCGDLNQDINQILQTL